MKPQLLAELTYHLVNSIILTGVVSILVLWRYRVSVLAGMAGGEEQILPLPNSVSPAEPPVAHSPALALRWERHREWRVVWAYFVAALLSAAPLSLGQAYVHDLWPVYPSRILMMTLLYTFACAPMIVA